MTLRKISLSALCYGRTILGTDFASARLRKRRTIFYAAFGSLSVLFASHGVVMYGWRLQYVRMSLSWMCWTAVANICGAIIYAMRVSSHRALRLHRPTNSVSSQNENGRVASTCGVRVIKFSISLFSSRHGYIFKA